MDKFLTRGSVSKMSTIARKSIVSNKNDKNCVEIGKIPLNEANLSEFEKKNVSEKMTTVCLQKAQKCLSDTALKTISDSRLGNEENSVPATDFNKNLSRKNDNVHKAAISGNQQATVESAQCATSQILSKEAMQNKESELGGGAKPSCNVARPPSIMKELMKGIVVYVEVRSNEDNRSEGVKRVIAELGARVNNKLLRDTTHVVFKDGLLSTYRKAKNWNIPIVSILWIEACKTQRCICNPLDYPISNEDRYENPEYYEKMKRIKAMQPDSELNKRVRNKPGTPKTGASRAQKATANVKSTHESSTPTTKTDIHKIKSNKVSTLKSAINNNNNNKIVQYFTPEHKKYTQNQIDSPATVFLNKIDSLDGNTRKPLEFDKEENKCTKEKEEQTILNVTHTAPLEMDVSAIDKKCNKSTPKKTNQRRQSVRVKTKNITEEQKVIVSEVPEEPKTPSANLSLILNEGEKNKTILQAQPMDESINDLCATLSTTRIPGGGKEPTTTVPFDSARKPGHRRTMFDLSMDIISERLQNINRSARRSVMPIEKLKQVESPTIFAKNETMTINNESNTPINNIVKKKRKLFVPNNNDSSLVFGTPPPLTSTQLSAGLLNSGETIENPLIKLTPRIEKKRRRTIMHSSPKVGTTTKKNININKEDVTTPNSAMATKVTQRKRNLMPLMEDTYEKNDHVEACKNTAVATKSSSRNGGVVTSSSQPPINVASRCEQKNDNMLEKAENTHITCSAPPIVESSAPKMNSNTVEKRGGLQRRSTFDFVDDKQKQLALNKPKKLTKRDNNVEKVMVFTNMHRQQSEIIRQAVKDLGKFVLENVVTEKTTHLISLEPRRTMNLLRGLARGLWILDYLWITESLAAGQWLEEEPYELKGFSNAIKICRAERQAFGSSYRCELFTGLGAFFISPSCGPMSKDFVTELIRLGGGSIAETYEKSKYIVTTMRRAVDDKIQITLKWVLDSLTQMQIQPHYKYAPSISHTLETYN